MPATPLLEQHTVKRFPNTLPLGAKTAHIMCMQEQLSATSIASATITQDVTSVLHGMDAEMGFTVAAALSGLALSSQPFAIFPADFSALVA